ncbi:MFS transporter [Peribacillus frigoritolerans]|uniref:MFS transporter n=1 Tax=Peribacillus frigoritolerans TaxID=450367 RepID=UPI0024C18EAE|nr:MFS transporter [Peribacillus frigoritolerans]WHX68864.1 MFS transporter [Peribacillus frigoritolerans]
MKHKEEKKWKNSKKARIIILLLFLLTVISNADKAIIGFASVSIMDELGLTAEQWGIVGSVFFLLYSVSAILGGSLADRFGTRIVIACMAAVWVIVQFSSIYVTSFTYLLITRIILGAGEGPSYSLAMTAASKWLPKDKLGLGLTLVSVGGPLGVAMTAPILMNLILSYGWRSAFIATGIVGLIWIVFWLWLAKEEADSEKESSVTKNVSNVSTSLPETKFSSVLLSKNFILIALCGFATYWSFTIGLNWLPNYFENIRQLSEDQLKIVVSLPWILITISQIVFSAISDRLYHKTQNVVKGRVFILGPVMLAGAASYFLGTIISSNFIAITLLSLGLTFGCITLVLGPAILVDLVSRQHQGKIQGWFMALTSLGGIVGPYVTGVLIENSSNPASGFQYSFQICALLLLIFGGLVWVAVRPKKFENTSNVLSTKEVLTK